MFIVQIAYADRVAFAAGRQMIGLAGYATRFTREDAEKVAAEWNGYNDHNATILPATFGGCAVRGLTYRAGCKCYTDGILTNPDALARIRSREERI